MDALSAFRAGPPKGQKPKKRLTTVELRDEKTKQALVIEHDEALDAFNIDTDTAKWLDEAHTDAVLVGELDGDVVVCFVELTGRTTDEIGVNGESSAEHKLRQLTGVAKHFHPADRDTGNPSHGARHHDAFASGSDDLTCRPAGAHRVLGVVVATRQGSRLPTPPLKLGNTVMLRQFRNVSQNFGVATISFRKLVDL